MTTLPILAENRKNSSYSDLGDLGMIQNCFLHSSVHLSKVCDAFSAVSDYFCQSCDSRVSFILKSLKTLVQWERVAQYWS